MYVRPGRPASSATEPDHILSGCTGFCTLNSPYLSPFPFLQYFFHAGKEIIVMNRGKFNFSQKEKKEKVDRDHD